MAGAGRWGARAPARVRVGTDERAFHMGPTGNNNQEILERNGSHARGPLLSHDSRRVDMWPSCQQTSVGVSKSGHTHTCGATHLLRFSCFRRRLGSSVPTRTSGNSKNHSYSYKLIILFYLNNSPISGHAIFLDVRLVSSGI